jgi:hypothetical protein
LLQDKENASKDHACLGHTHHVIIFIDQGYYARFDDICQDILFPIAILVSLEVENDLLDTSLCENGDTSHRLIGIYRLDMLFEMIGKHFQFFL